jgi:hypothetical protein
MNSMYNQDECVAAIRDFYHFLVKMYMDPSHIFEQPPDGWPSITLETAVTGVGAKENPTIFWWTSEAESCFG